MAHIGLILQRNPKGAAQVEQDGPVPFFVHPSSLSADRQMLSGSAAHSSYALNANVFDFLSLFYGRLLFSVKGRNRQRHSPCFCHFDQKSRNRSFILTFLTKLYIFQCRSVLLFLAGGVASQNRKRLHFRAFLGGKTGFCLPCSKALSPLPQFERDSLNHGKKAFYGRIPV